MILGLVRFDADEATQRALQQRLDLVRVVDVVGHHSLPALGAAQ